MISFLEGVLLAKAPLNVVVQVGGVGYSVQVPLSVSEKLGASGSVVCLHTLAVYKQDSQKLYGFLKLGDRNLFALIVGKVSGVGPKLALALFSKFTSSELEGAIAGEDTVLLSQTPGLGKKTAERICVELADRLATKSIASSAVSPQHQDAVAALVALGYKASKAREVITKVLPRLGSEASIQEILKAALS